MKKKEGEVLLLKEYTISLGGHKEKNKNNGIIANPNARRESETTKSQRVDL